MSKIVYADRFRAIPNQLCLDGRSRDRTADVLSTGRPAIARLKNEFPCAELSSTLLADEVRLQQIREIVEQRNVCRARDGLRSRDGDPASVEIDVLPGEGERLRYTQAGPVQVAATGAKASLISASNERTSLVVRYRGSDRRLAGGRSPRSSPRTGFSEITPRFRTP